jgi:hypothetical protein
MKYSEETGILDKIRKSLSADANLKFLNTFTLKFIEKVGHWATSL